MSSEEALKEAGKAFISAKHQWLNSQCRTEVLQRIDSVRPHQGWQIIEAFALGLGELVYVGPKTLSFAKSLDTKQLYLKKSMAQLAAFIDMVQHGKTELGSRGRMKLMVTVETPTSSIKLFAQDPGFSDIDAQFLASIGVQILRNPEAQLQVHSKAFTFCPFLPRYDVAEILSQCTSMLPSLHIAPDIWMREAVEKANARRHSLAFELGKRGRTVQMEALIFREFAQSRERRVWPRVDRREDDIGDDLVIYGRTTRESRSDEGSQCECIACAFDRMVSARSDRDRILF